MPAKGQSKKPNAETLRAGEDLQASTRRHFCTHLKFWTACGDKQCLRAHACLGDANKCFLRLWPVVPEDLKIYVRATIKARHAGLSPVAAAAEAAREMARWRETMAQADAEPAPNSRAPIHVAPGPRIRVL